MAVVQISKIQVRRGQENTTGIPRLDPGEFGWAEDTEHLYIGKRIDEGASSNDNSRILTDKDLNNLFGLLGNVGAATTTTIYQYRNTDLAINPYSKLRNILDKLDDAVNLKDFINPIENDSFNFQTAITQIFANQNADERRILKIPAGIYTLTGTVDLPPYTTLIGEGPDVTKIIYSPAPGIQSPMFRTIDANGVNFDTGTMAVADNQSARSVHIEGMTLQYASTSSLALLSLDNVQDPTVTNVWFGDPTAAILTQYGTGIAIRGTATNLTTTPLKDIYIDHCKFNSIGYGVQQIQGTTNRYKIQNSEFTFIGDKAISIWGATFAEPGPTHGVIDNNLFDNVVNETIYIGTTTVSTQAYTITSNNKFINVSGNTSVVVFNDTGNTSLNDYFKRFDDSNQSPPGTYFPLVSGNASVSLGHTHNTVINPGTDYAPVISIPVVAGQQMVTVNYQLNNNDMSRTGQLNINISPGSLPGGAYASVSDYYNYSENIANASLNLTFSTGLTTSANNNYITLTCLNYQDPNTTTAAAVATNFEYQITLLT